MGHITRIDAISAETAVIKTPENGKPPRVCSHCLANSLKATIHHQNRLPSLSTASYASNRLVSYQQPGYRGSTRPLLHARTPLPSIPAIGLSQAGDHSTSTVYLCCTRKGRTKQPCPRSTLSSGPTATRSMAMLSPSTSSNARLTYMLMVRKPPRGRGDKKNKINGIRICGRGPKGFVCSEAFCSKQPGIKLVWLRWLWQNGLQRHIDSMSRALNHTIQCYSADIDLL